MAVLGRSDRHQGVEDIYPAQPRGDRQGIDRQSLRQDLRRLAIAEGERGQQGLVPIGARVEQNAGQRRLQTRPMGMDAGHEKAKRRRRTAVEFGLGIGIGAGLEQDTRNLHRIGWRPLPFLFDAICSYIVQQGRAMVP